MQKEADIAVRTSSLDIQKIRNDFPILSRQVNGVSLVYLDNAASSQMPRQVIDRFVEYQTQYHSNVHRGVHTLSQEATDAYEKVRFQIQKFIAARDHREIIYTYGTTDSINLVAQTYGRTNLKSGDEILVSNMEHHANIVPWDLLAKEVGAIIKVIPITDEGEIDLDVYRSLFSNRTRIVAINHVSNALGTVNPVKEMTKIAHENDAIVMVDGAQAVPHMKVDVTDLNCDFYAFSGHKMLGPTGVGALYGKMELLKNMPPYRGGGDMILSVSFDEITYNEPPFIFEAGTPPIAQVIMLGAAIEYLQSTGLDKIAVYEHELLEYATNQVAQIDGLRIIGTAKNKASVLSFVLKGIHPHDIGTILDQHGVAVRSGHHCAQPVMERFNVPATTRASFAFYNSHHEIDTFVKALKNVVEVFG